MNDTARAAQQFMEYHSKGKFAVETLDLIIDAAISHDLEHARIGTGILFTGVIEPLSDTFLVRDRDILHKVLAHLIARLRLLPQAKQFHQKLNRWGLSDETGLLNRMERLALDKPFDPASIGKVKKVFIPSRVTLGADVLLNSPVIEKMKQRFPGAEIVFLGDEKNGSLLKGDQPLVRIHPIRYSRRDVLLNRFLIWLNVIRALEQEVRELDQGEDYIVVNTDSRLLQSGLLPILSPGKEKNRYFFWKPSVHREAWQGTSQAEDLLQWLEFTFGTALPVERIYPRIYFQAEDDAFAGNISKMLDPARKKSVVSMSFGVGGNQEKRVKYSSEIVSRFEIGLIRKLLLDGVTLILDKGNGKEEFDQASAVMQAVGEMGFEMVEVSEDSPALTGLTSGKAVSRDARLIVFRGSIRKFASLINLSDIFIGYDSLGQHLAGALGRDVISIFSGYHSDLFPERWKPLGSGTIRLVKAQSGPFSLERQDELAVEVFELYKGGHAAPP